MSEEEEKHLEVAAKFRKLRDGLEGLISSLRPDTAAKVKAAARNCELNARNEVAEANEIRWNNRKKDGE